MYDQMNSFTANTKTGSLAQAVTADAASTNVIDLGTSTKTTIKPVGDKGPYLIIRVSDTADFATLTSLEILLRTHTAEARNAGTKEVQMWHFARAIMVKGAVLVNQQLPRFNYQRFIDLYFNVVGSSATAGEIIAYLSDAPEPAITDLDQVAL